MFGFGDGKINEAAEDYVRTVAGKSDDIYRQFIHHVAQCLADMSMTSEELAVFLGHDNTKIAFSAGIAAEQLLAARNVMGPKTGEKFEKAVFKVLERITNPNARGVMAWTPKLLEHCRIDPANMRIHTLSYMLMSSGLGESPVFQKFESSLYRTMISEIIMHEGDGVIMHLAPKHGLASADWLKS